MANKRHKPEEIVTKLRQVDVLARQYGRYGYRRIAALLSDELLNGEIFYSLKETQIIIEAWRKYYNTVRPHSALGYRPPAPEAIVSLDRRLLMN